MDPVTGIVTSTIAPTPIPTTIPVALPSQEPDKYPTAYQTKPSDTVSTTEPAIDNAPSVIIFRPKKVKLSSGSSATPYSKIKLGWHTSKTAIASNQGDGLTWTDALPLQRKHDEQNAKIKIKDKKTGLDTTLGEVKINLTEVFQQGKVSSWYSLQKGNNVTGQILMEMEFSSMSI